VFPLVFAKGREKNAPGLAMIWRQYDEKTRRSNNRALG
jgi:hypothetical protein